MKFEKIVKEVAKELNIPESTAEIVMRSQWKFLLETIQSGEFKPVHLIYLGKFHKNKSYDRQSRRNISGIQEHNL